MMLQAHNSVERLLNEATDSLCNTFYVSIYWLCIHTNSVFLCIDQCWTGWCSQSQGGLVEMAGF